jgi:hypothetical protein
MSTVRFRLRSLVTFWLLCQLATFAAAPVLSAAGIDRHLGQATCDCPDTEPGAACPMHKSPARSGRSESDCVMQSACPPQDAALLSLTSGLGIVPEQATLTVPSVVASVAPTSVLSRSRFALPAAPPPRA